MGRELLKTGLKIIFSVIIQGVCFFAVMYALVFFYYITGRNWDIDLCMAVVLTVLVFQSLLLPVYKIKPVKGKKLRVFFWIFNGCCMTFTILFFLVTLVTIDFPGLM